MKRGAVRAFAVVLAALILAVVTAIVVPGAELVAGALAIPVLALGLVFAAPRQRLISLVLLSLGVAALVAALLLGDRPTLPQLLALNQDLSAMIAATSFVGIVAQGARDRAPRLKGAVAVWRTAGLTHLLGAIVNTSAVAIVGDHLRREGPLRPADAALLSRSYMTAAFWSPFWAASAAALALVPHANVPVLVTVGLLLAGVTLAAGMPDLLRQYGDDLADYRGYALNWELLRVPIALLVAVVVAHLLALQTPVPRIVALCAIGVTLVALLLKDAPNTPRTLWRHTLESFPLLRGEISLFTSASVLTVGLGALFRALPMSLPIPVFDVLVAWLCVLAMTLVALVGVHQLISLAVIGSIILPLHPQPTLFALMATIGWGLASIVGPISGLQLYLQGRYGVSSIVTTRRNLLFAGIVLALAWPALLVVSVLDL